MTEKNQTYLCLSLIFALVDWKREVICKLPEFEFSLSSGDYNTLAEFCEDWAPGT